MAQILKGKYQIDVLGTTLYITDISGVYDVADNTGGWGSPNPSLAQSAIIALVQRFVGITGTSLTAISSQIVYDPSALNTKQTQFTFQKGLDGHIKITLFRLPVSLDGANTVESNEIVSGDYFYWNSSSHLLWKMVGVTPVAVEIIDLLGKVNVLQSTCEDLIFPSLAIKHNALYRTYKDERDEDCNAADVLFQEVLRLRLDLYGAKTCFRSGLITKAEDIINTLLKKYDLAV